MGKLLQSLVLGDDSRGFALHLNEAAVKSTEAGKDLALLLAGGVQGNIIPYLSIGVEVKLAHAISTRPRSPPTRSG